MSLITITEASKEFGISRTTLYERIKSGELSRNADKLIDTSDLLRVFGEPGSPNTEQSVNVQSDSMASDLLDIVVSKDAELAQMRTELDDVRERLNEHREAARALISPEDFKKKEEEWKTTLVERQIEIENARAEALEHHERELQAKAELTAMEERGIFDRIFNRKPKLVES